MKLCPACQTQYTDDTLQFCLQDGTPLTFASQSDTPTAVLNETETQAVFEGGKFQVPISNVSAGQQQSGYVAAVPEQKRTNTVMAVGLTAVGMLILFSIVGIAAWLYLRNSQPQKVSNIIIAPATPVAIVNNNLAVTTKTSRPSPSPTPTGNSNTTPPHVNDPQAECEVIRSLNSWKSQAEALDINAYMEHYAPVVDYYNKPGSDLSSVRADKMRAFSRYDSIRVNLSNITVTVDPADGTAVAVFDKEWDFQGDGSSNGKVRQMMRLRNINGQWLISAEKDLKLYYKR